MRKFIEVLKRRKFWFQNASCLSAFGLPLVVLVFIGVLNSCGFRSRSSTDMRAFFPKETLIYLESENLGETLQTLTESESFKRYSSGAKDFSVIDGLQLAVGVIGFETAEKQVTSEQSIINLKPQFVAVAETHAWSWQINSLVKNNLNKFVRGIYGDESELITSDENGEKWFTWSAKDGRKTFAVISGTQVFFGNNEEALNKCLDAKKGKVDDLRKLESLTTEREKEKGKIAFGFVSNEGVKSVAGLVGLSVALEKSEDENARGLISRVLPQVLKNTTKYIAWSASKHEQGIADHVIVKTKKEVSDVLSETIIASRAKNKDFYKFVPPDFFSVTRYNLKKPQIAFRSLLLVVAKNIDPITGKFLGVLSNSLLESYGVANAEGFLGSVDSEIISVMLDEDGEKSFAIVKPKDMLKIKRTISSDIDFNSTPTEKFGAEIWESKDKTLAVAVVEDTVVLGELMSVYKSLNKKGQISNRLKGHLSEGRAVTTTIERVINELEKIAGVLGDVKPSAKGNKTHYFTRTEFNKTGIERRYVSDFGFIGVILEQFASE